MKKLIWSLIVLFYALSAFAQQERVTSLELLERASFQRVNKYNELQDDTVFYTKPGFRVESGFDTLKHDNVEYVILRYPAFWKETKKQKTSSVQTQQQNEDSTKRKTVHVELTDITSEEKIINGRRLVMKKSVYESINKLEHYNTSYKNWGSYEPSFGVLTLPFKLRPKVDDTDFKITTDVTIGPYVGLTKRISRTRKYYVTIPVSAGLCFVNTINSKVTNTTDDTDLTKKEENTDADPNIETSIAVKPGITWASGLIFQLGDFNMGFVFGQDYVSEIGDDWIYNGKMWYSFGIGYNFITKDKKK